jgi:hypothetical protein
VGVHLAAKRLDIKSFPCHWSLFYRLALADAPTKLGRKGGQTTAKRGPEFSLLSLTPRGLRAQTREPMISAGA